MFLEAECFDFLFKSWIALFVNVSYTYALLCQLDAKFLRRVTLDTTLHIKDPIGLKRKL